MKRQRFYRLVTVLLGLSLAWGSAEAQRTPVPVDVGDRGWIGITFREGEAGSRGIVVDDVMPDAPAQAAGIRAGDRIVRWNGREDVAEAIRATPIRPGETVQIRVARQGQAERDIAVVAGPRPVALESARSPNVLRLRPGAGGRVLRIDRDSLFLRMDSLQSEIRLMLRDSLGPRLDELQRLRPGARVEIFRDSLGSFERFFPGGRVEFFRGDTLALEALRGGGLGVALAAGRGGVAGAELADLTPGLSTYFGADQGALVLRVAPGTPAARAGLQDGDVIVRARDQTVRAVVDLRRALADGRGDVPLEVLRRGARHSLTLTR